MTKVTEFCKAKNRGWTAGSLPMPDGTRRRYKEFGRNALLMILNKWQEEKAEMLAAQYLAGKENLA